MTSEQVNKKLREALKDVPKIPNMNAQQARAIADRKRIDELPEVYYLINKAAEQGNYKMYFYRQLEALTKEQLIKDGFKVSESFDRNELLITISWQS